MAKAKEKPKIEEVAPIVSPLNAVVSDFKAHMKATNVKVKKLTYDEVLEKFVDHAQELLAKHKEAGFQR